MPLNGHGKDANPDYEICHARFPHLNPLPQAGEEANESLREFHVNAAPRSCLSIYYPQLPIAWRL